MATFAGLTYTNGNVPASLLRPLDGENFGNAVLRRDAAESWNRARADVEARTGIVLTVRGWNRSLAEQERFFFERYSRQASGGGPFGDVRWYKGVRYVRTSGAPAAIPGTSNHGWGLAVDIDDFGAYRTTGNARSAKATPILERHGWTDNEGSSIGEPWHRVYNPASDTHPAIFQEDDMFTADHAEQLDQLHQKLLRLFTDGTQQVDVVDGVRRNLIVSRRIEDDVNHLVATNRAQSAAIKTLSESVGVDPAVVTTAVENSVAEAMAELKARAALTITLEG